MPHGEDDGGERVEQRRADVEEERNVRPTGRDDVEMTEAFDLHAAALDAEDEQGDREEVGQQHAQTGEDGKEMNDVMRSFAQQFVAQNAEDDFQVERRPEPGDEAEVDDQVNVNLGCRVFDGSVASSQHVVPFRMIE